MEPNILRVPMASLDFLLKIRRNTLPRFTCTKSKAKFFASCTLLLVFGAEVMQVTDYLVLNLRKVPLNLPFTCRSYENEAKIS